MHVGLCWLRSAWNVLLAAAVAFNMVHIQVKHAHLRTVYRTVWLYTHAVSGAMGSNIS